MCRSIVIGISALICTGLLTSCNKQPSKDQVVTLSAVPGPGRIATGLGGYGPASDPMGGELDLSDEIVQGVPDSLSDLNVRFLDFQWDLIVRDAFVKGRIDSATYERLRDPTLNVTPPDAPFDEHVHYAIGRRAGGDYVIIFDTDNDEDLSDEQGIVFPWSGPPLEVREYFEQLQGTRNWVERMKTLPQVTVNVQLSDGDHTVDAPVRLIVIPHLEAVFPTGQPGDTAHVPSYMIGAYQNMVGLTTIDGTEYTFWAGCRAYLGQYQRRSAEIWFEKGDQRQASVDSEESFVLNPFQIGQVIDLDGRYFRLDDISLDGSKLRLAAVESMPGLGIRPGMEAPQFEAVTIDGDALALSDYRGKYVLLDFWATTCGPCLKHLPEMRELYGEFSRDDLEILGIAEDEPDWLRKFVADNGIAWRQVTQDGTVEAKREILETYRVTGIPAYFLIDPEGHVTDGRWGLGPSVVGDSLRVWLGV